MKVIDFLKKVVTKKIELMLKTYKGVEIKDKVSAERGKQKRYILNYN